MPDATGRTLESAGKRLNRTPARARRRGRLRTAKGPASLCVPVETARGAPQATKASGQPDWPTRVAAVKALAVLRPDEVEQVEPENEQQPTPSIVVYDLPPGAGPVLHRASSGGETPVSAADTPLAKQPPDSVGYTFVYEPPGGKD